MSARKWNYTYSLIAKSQKSKVYNSEKVIEKIEKLYGVEVFEILGCGKRI